MGLRAVGHAAQSRNSAEESFSLDRAQSLAIAFACATFALHFIAAGRYGYQRDELYFMSCAHHLAFGYVDQPPLIAIVTRAVLATLGDSLYALRFLPALAASATVVLVGRLAARFGGGLLAQTLAMLGIALAPFYLAVGNLLTMNAFEPLLWLGAVALFLRASDRDDASSWTSLGVVAGLGLINKYSALFFLGSCIVGIALTPGRRVLLRPGFVGALALASAIVAPTLFWQARHGWPQLAVLHDANATKNVVLGPVGFYAQQLLMMNPLTAPIWIAGVVAACAAPRFAAVRWIGYAYVLLSVLYLALGAKTYYLAPVYPMLFVVGACALEPWLARARLASFVYPALLVVVALAIAPEAYPLLPLPTFERYEHVFDLRGIKMEKHPEGRVPQHFADELGWHSLVSTLARAMTALTPAQRHDAVVLAHDYGQASAVDFFGPKLGLPRAISGHNNYFLYGPRGASGAMVVAVGFDATLLRGEFAEVRRIGFYHDAYVLPDTNDLPIYACSRPRQPLAAWWPTVRRYL